MTTYHKKEKWRDERHTLSPHLTGLKILFGSKYWLWNYQVEKLSYVTPYHISDQVSKYADQIYRKSENLPGDLVVWDMFGGIGSDSISLSRYFSIITTELDEKTFDCLTKNISSFRLHNVNAIQGNCLSFLKTIMPDVIYYDPPWGESYKSKSSHFSFHDVFISYPTHLEGLPVNVRCTDLAKYLHENVCSKMIIKSPINSNSFDQLFQNYDKDVFIFPNKNLKFIYLK